MPTLHRNIKNGVLWKNKNGNLVPFSIKGLRGSDPKLNWTKLFWSELNIPSHGFILWMAIQGRPDVKSWEFSNDKSLCFFFFSKINWILIHIYFLNVKFLKWFGKWQHILETSTLNGFLYLKICKKD